jgi:hypothetical protein
MGLGAELAQLATLRREGALTAAEFTQAKRVLLQRAAAQPQPQQQASPARSPSLPSPSSSPRTTPPAGVATPAALAVAPADSTPPTASGELGGDPEKGGLKGSSALRLVVDAALLSPVSAGDTPPREPAEPSPRLSSRLEALRAALAEPTEAGHRVLRALLAEADALCDALRGGLSSSGGGVEAEAAGQLLEALGGALRPSPRRDPRWRAGQRGMAALLLRVGRLLGAEEAAAAAGWGWLSQPSSAEGGGGRPAGLVWLAAVLRDEQLYDAVEAFAHADVGRWRALLGGGGGGESSLRVHWVAVPEAARARRVSRRRRRRRRRRRGGAGVAADAAAPVPGGRAAAGGAPRWRRDRDRRRRGARAVVAGGGHAARGAVHRCVL